MSNNLNIYKDDLTLLLICQAIKKTYELKYDTNNIRTNGVANYTFGEDSPLNGVEVKIRGITDNRSLLLSDFLIDARDKAINRGHSKLPVAISYAIVALINFRNSKIDTNLINKVLSSYMSQIPDMSLGEFTPFSVPEENEEQKRLFITIGAINPTAITEEFRNRIDQREDFLKTVGERLEYEGSPILSLIKKIREVASKTRKNSLHFNLPEDFLINNRSIEILTDLIWVMTHRYPLKRPAINCFTGSNQANIILNNNGQKDLITNFDLANIFKTPSQISNENLEKTDPSFRNGRATSKIEPSGTDGDLVKTEPGRSP